MNNQASTDILILTGPPGSGKNTIAAALAQHLARCAVIDVDLVRWMVMKPHRAPWDGPEGKTQQALSIQNACVLAKRFRQAGYPVVLHDVLSDDTADLYRAELAGSVPKIILLLPTVEEILRRNTLRPPRLHPHEIALLYEQQRQLTTYDLKIDNTTLTAEEVATRIAGLTHEENGWS